MKITYGLAEFDRYTGTIDSNIHLPMDGVLSGGLYEFLESAGEAGVELWSAFPCGTKGNSRPIRASRFAKMRRPHRGNSVHLQESMSNLVTNWLTPGLDSETRTAWSPLAQGLHQLVDGAVKALSVRRCSSILPMECITVVWCLPPNWRPISGSDASVSCLARYMAIWRGTTIWRELFFCLSSADAHSELLGHRALDGLDGDLAHLGVDELLEALLRD